MFFYFISNLHFYTFIFAVVDLEFSKCEKDDKITIITTQRGKESALHEGYRYYVKQHYKDGSMSWICVNKKTTFCPATILTKDDRVVTLLKKHTCTPDHKNNEKMKILHRCMSKVDPHTATASKVYKEIINDYEKSNFDLGKAPTTKQVWKLLENRKRKRHLDW